MKVYNKGVTTKILKVYYKGNYEKY